MPQEGDWMLAQAQRNFEDYIELTEAFTQSADALFDYIGSPTPEEQVDIKWKVAAHKGNLPRLRANLAEWRETGVWRDQRWHPVVEADR